jgi:signal transduction histidine kinase/CheY-like chemotaxis protein
MKGRNVDMSRGIFIAGTLFFLVVAVLDVFYFTITDAFISLPMHLSGLGMLIFALCKATAVFMKTMKDMNEAKEVKQRLKIAEESTKAKSDFLAKMSHEIRTPMNAITGMTELILWEELSPVVREHALTIKNSGGHLLNIINDILDFSKIETGKMEIVEAEYLFYSTINDVVNMINARMTNPNVQFVAEVSPDVPGKMYGDEGRLRQVLLNVLSNSMKYTREGRITLAVSWEKIGEDTLLLSIRVADTGIGIRRENLKTLFDEFQQFDLQKNRNVEGTGLGLAITHSLVQLMGGEISVESTYGEGSVFTITLPQKFSTTYEHQEWEREEPTTMTRVRMPDVKILVVDDVLINLEVAKGILAPYQAHVDDCLSGKEALELVKQNDYDLILMDHMMSEMDGLETTATIRKLDGGRFADTPIIALTANAAGGAKEMFLQNGMSDFLSKPIELEKLDYILTKWIPAEKQIKETRPLAGVLL